MSISSRTIRHTWSIAPLPTHNSAITTRLVETTIEHANSIRTMSRSFTSAGVFSWMRQELELALHDFDRVVELADDHDAARFRHAGILLNLVYLKRQTEALRDYERLIARHPDEPHAYWGRASPIG